MKRKWMLLHPIQIDHSTNARSHAFTLISTLIFTNTSSCFKQTLNLHVTINIRSQQNSQFLLKRNFFQWMHATEKNTNWISSNGAQISTLYTVKRINKTYAEMWTKKRANVNENKIREYSLITRNNCFQIIVSLRVQMHGAPTMQTRKKFNIEMKKLNWIGQKSGAAIRKKPMWLFDATLWEKKRGLALTNSGQVRI